MLAALSLVVNILEEQTRKVRIFLLLRRGTNYTWVAHKGINILELYASIHVCHYTMSEKQGTYGHLVNI